MLSSERNYIILVAVHERMPVVVNTQPVMKSNKELVIVSEGRCET
jgi:hypothetical protein